MLVKNISKPDETRVLPKTNIEVVEVDGITLMRATFHPGWKWSEHVKPTVGTDSCLAPHINYVISGRMMIVMDDGEQKEMGPGDFAVIAPGHNAWVLGDVPCVAIDFGAGKNYAKPK
jgi:quercetin dioxygenase-like cupin family protein